MTDSYGIPYRPSLTELWGHFSPQLLIAAIAAVIVLGLRPVAPGALTLLVATFLIAFVLVTWMLMRQHDRRLCESCAASIPLNPAAQAARYTMRFWLIHRGSNPRIAAPYLIVLIGSNFLTSSSGRIAWAVIQSSMMYLIAATATHRRLQPWCPWCSEDGGGDGAVVGGPDLPRGGRRQLV
jgi:hypothetical protein